ncbi:MAG: bifunctional anthranilate synthase component II/anthranilate phosphoribosyltransferase [Anaerovoracaceae bacterium]
MILLIDNYDSFSYNLYQLIGSIEPDIKVVRNDSVTVEDVKAMRPSAIILSPGPGRPENAGICIDVVKKLAGTVPILGVCLGHQSIALAYGGKIVHAKKLMHGMQSDVKLDTSCPVFAGCPDTVKAARYHSLAVDRDSLPAGLTVTAAADDGEIMGVMDKAKNLYGVQFHPESVMTPQGSNILENFIELSRENKGGEKMISEAIKKIVDKKDLTYDEAYGVMNEIMNGDTTPTQNAAYLAALSTKSARAETIDEIAGSARAMREHALPVHHSMPVLEIVGTGGDHSGSINVSTTASFIIAAAGIPVAKHGNRAASSLSGAADCYEALGVNIEESPEKCDELLNGPGLCFMFAQKYHSSMKYVGAIRKELGIRTVFNILGPLTNPANPEMMMLGVYDEYLIDPLAKVLTSLGVKRGMVFHGTDGFDEISAGAPTKICEIDDGKYTDYEIKPEDFGFTPCKPEDVKGGSPQENAEDSIAILSGKKGPKYNMVVMNAGAAIYIGGKADSIADGIKKAEDLIASGAAMKKLEEFREVSNS